MNVSGVVGTGPDHGHLLRQRSLLAPDRQRRAGVEQDDRALGDLAGQLPVGGRVEVDLRGVARPTPRASTRRRAGRAVPWRGAPDGRPGRRAPRRGHPSGPARPVRRRTRACRAARRRCRPRGPARRPRRARRDPVHGGQERDGPVVGDHRALEAPLVAQHVGEQPGVGARRDAVDVGVGVHHRARRHRSRRPSRTEGRMTSRSSRAPIDTGPWLRAAREAE